MNSKLGTIIIRYIVFLTFFNNFEKPFIYDSQKNNNLANFVSPHLKLDKPYYLKNYMVHQMKLKL